MVVFPLLMALVSDAPLVMVPVQNITPAAPVDTAIRVGVTAALKGTEYWPMVASTEGRRCPVADTACHHDVARSLDARLILVPEVVSTPQGCSFNLTVFDILSSTPAAQASTPEQKDCPAGIPALRDAAQEVATRALKHVANHPKGTPGFGGLRPDAGPNTITTRTTTSRGGGLTKEEIYTAIQASMPAIKACYQQGLKRDAELEGHMMVGFSVTPDGHTAEVAMGENTVGDAAVGACVLNAMRKTRFPAPRGGGAVKVNFPFVFDPDE
jgi:TonB family protein